MSIPADHPDAGNPLFAAVARALTHLGAVVEIVHRWAGEAGENLVRALPAPGACRDLAWPPRAPHRGPPLALVRAEGLPNLLHELVHVVLAARLDDDHGIDYGAIPYDLDTASGRRILWEELACCVVSCAYVGARRPGEGASEAARRVDAWFVEQVEIQPVFYGYPDDGAELWQTVRERLARHGPEQARIEALAYARVEQLLLMVHASPSVARPPYRLTLVDLLARRRRAA